MTKINYQALREAAERAIPAMERLLMLPVDDDLISEQELKDYGVDIDALNAFKFLALPETVLALLDERERNQQYIKRRDQENEDIALTVGKLLIENGRLVADTLRHLADNEIDSDYFAITSTNENGTEIDHEMAITDYALQAAGTVDELVAALESAEKRIAELEAEPVSQTYKLNKLSGNSSVTPDGWISCSDRMPEMGERQYYVLAADFKNNYPPSIPNTQVGVYGDWFNDGNPTWDDGDGEDLHLKEVTHWMPLPEPPQEVK
ncbi:ead/Ea22-like family protein [Escherichia coli]|uniref:ead/Ea22-like family protein n=1 Tax=Escherichia coli TaxID=562 RepID=UPI00295362E2|nr:ead/Ea22-like family protein [Escherichia coli]CAK0661207.1 ead/Ea22-like family protein [Escherichia coli]